MRANPPFGKIAIIAGDGVLPKLLAEACERQRHPYQLVRISGARPAGLEDTAAIEFAFEGFGALFAALKQAGCGSVVFAGSVRRPVIDPGRFDTKTRKIAPRLLPLIGGGDDAILRAIADEFEAEGFGIIPAADLVSDLLAGLGAHGKISPSKADKADITRAVQICKTLGQIDVGQGAVVAQGLCLGLESLQGTDQMLRFVTDTASGLRPDPAGAKGVLYKAPKPGQDIRLDMPAIGPATIKNAASAGLAGVAVTAGAVLILEREETIATADRLGLFIYGVSGLT